MDDDFAAWRRAEDEEIASRRKAEDEEIASRRNAEDMYVKRREDNARMTAAENEIARQQKAAEEKAVQDEIARRLAEKEEAEEWERKADRRKADKEKAVQDEIARQQEVERVVKDEVAARQEAHYLAERLKEITYDLENDDYNVVDEETEAEEAARKAHAHAEEDARRKAHAQDEEAARRAHAQDEEAARKAHAQTEEAARLNAETEKVIQDEIRARQRATAEATARLKAETEAAEVARLKKKKKKLSSQELMRAELAMAPTDSTLAETHLKPSAVSPSDEGTLVLPAHTLSNNRVNGRLLRRSPVKQQRLREISPLRARPTSEAAEAVHALTRAEAKAQGATKQKGEAVDVAKLRAAAKAAKVARLAVEAEEAAWLQPKDLPEVNAEAEAQQSLQILTNPSKSLETSELEWSSTGNVDQVDLILTGLGVYKTLFANVRCDVGQHALEIPPNVPSGFYTLVLKSTTRSEINAKEAIAWIDGNTDSQL